MTIRRILTGSGPATWAVYAAAIAALAIVLWLLIFSAGHNRREAAVGKVTTTLAEARGRSASEAAGIQDAARTAAEQSETLSRSNADAIQAAPGADVRLDPHLNRAARERLCLRAAYRSRAECQPTRRGPMTREP